MVENTPTPTEPLMVSNAKAAAESLRIENERLEANLKRLDELKAFETLGGRSLGAPQEVKPVVETPQEYAKRVLEGKIQFSK